MRGGGQRFCFQWPMIGLPIALFWAGGAMRTGISGPDGDRVIATPRTFRMESAISLPCVRYQPGSQAGKSTGGRLHGRESSLVLMHRWSKLFIPTLREAPTDAEV